MNKVFLTALGVGLVGTSALFISSVSAQTDNTVTPFVQKLAEKLGIDEAKVQTAFFDVRTELREERSAERAASIAQAVTDGKLTQRQADLLTAMQEYRDEFRETHKPGEMRQSMASLEELKTKMQEELVTYLNDKGYNTSVEELETLHDALREAGIGPMGPRGGRPGFEM